MHSFCKSFLLFSVSFFLASCTRPQFVAAVGTQRIFKRNVEAREKMMRFFDESINEQKATDQLISFEVRKYILQSKGFTISDSEVEDFLKSQKDEAKGNAQLAKFLETFEKDSKFREVYLFPQVVDKKIGEIYEKDVAFNKMEFDLANSLLSRAQAVPLKFESIAKELSIPFLRGTLHTASSTIEWESGKEVAGTLKIPADRPWFVQSMKNNYLAKATSGKMVPQIWPLWFGYVILRNDQSTKDKDSFSMAVAPRKPRWQWEKENSLLIKVDKFDTNSPNKK